jgi:hypothetical protein
MYGDLPYGLLVYCGFLWPVYFQRTIVASRLSLNLSQRHLVNWQKLKAQVMQSILVRPDQLLVDIDWLFHNEAKGSVERGYHLPYFSNIIRYGCVQAAIADLR